jgi:peptidoglycan glycosyltransferase
MNPPLRRVGVVVLVLFALLFINLNWVQASPQADKYRDDEHNGRVQTSEYQRQRGTIQVQGGVAVATSKATDDELKFLRTYPLGAPYAHVVGYKPVNLGPTGIEKLENAWLSGNAPGQFADRLAEMFSGNRAAGGNVLLSLSPAGQETAYKQLVNNKLGKPKGAVVALDPKTGGILAAVSIPSYDPNPFADHSTKTAQDAFDKLDADPNKPLLNRAFSETFPPGSTFKVITSATALANGVRPDTVLTGGPTYQPPQTTQVIQNAPGVNCANQITLLESLTISCNTAFSRLCVDQLGADKIKGMAQAFGFEDTLRLDHDDKNVMATVPSHTGAMEAPDGTVDKPALAQSCIGQRDVRMTPLQGALIAATVANGGSQMRPYLIEKEFGADLTSTNYVVKQSQVRQPINGQVAGDLRDMMISVVDRGTGRNAQIKGFQVGGKTGTAQAGEAADHGWFIGFAMKDGVPQVAVAVLLETAGASGSSEATRIGGEVMHAVLTERGLG